jgi:predicted permease
MFGRRKRTHQDFSEELRAHLAIEADRLRAEGLSEAEAWATAHRNLGNMTSSQERFYETSRWLWLDHLWQDLRYAFRQLRKSRGFTFVAVLTLALGIGANTAIFTLVHAVMLKSLPIAHPEQLYRLGNTDACCVISGFQGRGFSIFSYPLYQQFRDHIPELESMAAFTPASSDAGVRRNGDSAPALPMRGEFVSGNYFSMLGLSVFRGRALTPTDDTPGASPAAVLSYRAWQTHFSLDASLIGSTLVIDGVAVTVAGVTPPGFFGETLRSDPPDLWFPIAIHPVLRGKNSVLSHPDDHWLYIIGRLKPGARPEAAESKANVLLQQWLNERVGTKFPADVRKRIAQQHVAVIPAGGGVATLKGDYGASLRLLLAVTGLVLLIACANIANLILARRAATRGQTALRLALGAGRGRIVRQALTESIVLALLGGAAGLFVALAGSRAILLLAFRGAAYVPISSDPSLPVLGFTFLLSLLTGIVFGVVPAWSASRSDPVEALRGAGRSTAGNSTVLQKSLVVFQAALSLVLLCGAGLLTQTLRNLETQQFGFETEGRLMVKINPAFTDYGPARIGALYRQLRERLSQIPGVLSASLSQYSPMEGINWGSTISIDGHTTPPGEREFNASWVRVSPRYFETIGTRLLRGRVVEERDTPASTHVAVINEAFARIYFRNEDPIGKHFGMESGLDYEIVGVVADAKYHEAREPVNPTFFLPLLQMSEKEWAKSSLARSNFIHDIELRLGGRPGNLEAQVRRTIAETDPNVTVVNVENFAEQVSLNFNLERLIARLTGIFGALALLLACIGLYGVMAYSVARRSGEIGVRIALGAGRGSVIGMVLRGACLQIGLGLAIGLPVTLAAGRALASQLYGVKSYDPLVLGGAAVVLAACALIASFLPARRAASIHPMQALRSE